MPYPLVGEDADYRGHAIRGAKCIITKAGDGLSDALVIDPMGFEPGERAWYIVEVETQKVRLDPVSPTSEDMTQVHIQPAQRIVLVDPDRSIVPRKALDREQRRVEKVKQSMKGQEEFDGVVGGPGDESEDGEGDGD